MNQLYVGIDVGSAKSAAYLMMPDGSKQSSFSVQNNLGGAKLSTEKIVSALNERDLSSVTIGMEATSVYGNTQSTRSLRTGVLDVLSVRSMCSIQSRSASSKRHIQICRRMTP